VDEFNQVLVTDRVLTPEEIEWLGSNPSTGTPVYADDPSIQFTFGIEHPERPKGMLVRFWNWICSFFRFKKKVEGFSSYTFQQSMDDIKFGRTITTEEYLETACGRMGGSMDTQYEQRIETCEEKLSDAYRRRNSSDVKAAENPYDFLDDFDRWFQFAADRQEMLSEIEEGGRQ